MRPLAAPERGAAGDDATVDVPGQHGLAVTAEVGSILPLQGVAVGTQSKRQYLIRPAGAVQSAGDGVALLCSHAKEMPFRSPASRTACYSAVGAWGATFAAAGFLDVAAAFLAGAFKATF